MKDTAGEGKLLEERRWESGWEDHEALQRRRLASLSLPEKLVWLEQTHCIVTHLRTFRHAPAADGDTRGK